MGGLGLWPVQPRHPESSSLTLALATEPWPTRCRRLATLERCLSADTVLCSGCVVNKDEELVLLCDGCNLGMHTYCLEPPLAVIPDGQWFCKGCAAAIAAARKACPARKRPLLGGGGGGGGGGERPLKEARTTASALIGESPFAGRCERNAWCVRGFKHGGRGGICSDRAALNLHQPSSSAAPSASSPSSASTSTSATVASASASMSPAGKGPASPRAERSPTRPRAAAAPLLSVHAITPELSLSGGGGAPNGVPTGAPTGPPTASSSSSSAAAAAASSSAAASSAASAAAEGATAALPSRKLTAFRVCGCEPPHLTAPLRAGGAGGAGFSVEHLQGLQLEGLLARPPSPPSPPRPPARPYAPATC